MFFIENIARNIFSLGCNVWFHLYGLNEILFHIIVDQNIDLCYKHLSKSNRMMIHSHSFTYVDISEIDSIFPLLKCYTLF